MSLFSPSRCVFLLSDEGLSIYDASSSRSVLLDTVPWNTQDFDDAVVEIVRKKCRGKSILILNDMVEQHYRKERVPKVSPFDRANILKRRVSAAFPSYPIRSSIKLKERAPARENQPAGGDIYLFAAVPLSESVRKTLTAVQKTYSSVAGFCLLPVESASMIHTLSKKLSKVTERAATWTVFVGQHQSGGLRQIVTKNGELALTRMTPIVDSDIDHELWSSEVAGEIKGTMSYLSRFGFDATDGLDVIVIANNSVADKVAAKIDFDCNLSVLTSQEAANLLGVKLGRQDDQRYADPLHVAWSGRKTAFTLPLQAAQLDQIATPAKYATAASLILLCACGYFGYQSFSKASEWAANNADLSRAEDALTVVKQEHEAEVAKKAAVGVDFMLIENSTKVYSKLEKVSMKPLPVFDLIGRSLGPDIHIKSLDVKPVAEKSVLEPAASPEPVDPNAEVAQREYEVVIRIIFPSELAPEVGVQKIAELERRLKSNLPNHAVSIIKQVADLSYTGNFVGEATSQKTTDEKKEDYEAQILIKGALI
jgi:hypothetical protein